MATDVLVLGGFVFEGFAAPERLPGGGKQVLSIQKMPGGQRVIDAWGPDDHDRSWSGIFWGDNALDDALALDAMRISGAELPYSNGIEARLAIIEDFSFEVRKVTCVEYKIRLALSDDSGGGGFGFGLALIDDIVGADLSFAIGLLP